MIVFSDLCETTQGVQISKVHQSKDKLYGYIRYLYISDLLNDASLKYIKNEYPHKIVTEDDLVVANTGSPGKVFKGKYGILSNNLFRLSFDPNRVNRDYLYYILSSEIFQVSLQKQMKGGIQKHLGHKTMGRQKIPLPPLPDQKRIATILDEADKLRQLDKQLLEKYDKLAQSLFLDMFGDVRVNSKKWETTKFENIIALKSGTQLSAKNMSKGIYPVFGGNGINGYHNEYIFEEPMIVIGRVGAYCGNIHKTKPKSWITDNALYISKQFIDYNEDYLIYLLKNLKLNQYASQSGQPLISFGRIKSVEIIVPPIELQNQFAERIAAIEAQKAQVQTTLANSNNLFDSLLQKAFKGEL